MGLEIELGLDSKNNSDNDKPTENGTTFDRVQKRAPDVNKKVDVANKGPNLEQQKANTNFQKLCTLIFFCERPRLAAFANVIMKLTNQRGQGSVKEIRMKNGFSKNSKIRKHANCLHHKTSSKCSKSTKQKLTLITTKARKRQPNVS